MSSTVSNIEDKLFNIEDFSFDVITAEVEAALGGLLNREPDQYQQVGTIGLRLSKLIENKIRYGEVLPPDDISLIHIKIKNEGSDYIYVKNERITESFITELFTEFKRDSFENTKNAN